MSVLVPLKRLARLRYGDALPAAERKVGSVHVMGSGGATGFHDVANTDAPAIVVGRKGSYGSVKWAPKGAFVIDTAYYIDRQAASVDLRWLYYALHSADLRGPSQDVGVPGLSREVAHNTLLPAPPSLDAQVRIAAALDAWEEKFAETIRLRHNQLSLVEERFRSAVDDVFSSSGSGAETRVKRLLTQRPTYGVLVPEFVDQGTPFIRVQDLGLLEQSDLSLPSIPVSLSAQYRRTILREGDVLVSVVGTLGRAAVVPRSLEGANVNRAIACLRVKPLVNRDLFVAWLGARHFEIQALDATASDSAQRTLGMEDLSNFAIRWPRDPQEQHEMATTVVKTERECRELRGLIERQVQLLHERRQAFITAAMTGRIDVTSGREANV